MLRRTVWKKEGGKTLCNDVILLWLQRLMHERKAAKDVHDCGRDTIDVRNCWKAHNNSDHFVKRHPVLRASLLSAGTVVAVEPPVSSRRHQSPPTL